jgi:hypothetical protein
MGAKSDKIYCASDLYIGVSIANYPMIKIFF